MSTHYVPLEQRALTLEQARALKPGDRLIGVYTFTCSTVTHCDGKRVGHGHKPFPYSSSWTDEPITEAFARCHVKDNA